MQKMHTITIKMNTSLTIASVFITIICLKIFLDRLMMSLESVSIVNYEMLKCDSMFDRSRSSLERGSLFSFDDEHILNRIRSSNDRCTTFQSIFNFFQYPLSTEEDNFPLAYGMLVHADFVQISFMLSAIYQPQNQFCIAIDGKADQEFIDMVGLLSTCYPNIHYFIAPKIRWCGYEILTSVFECVKHLSGLQNNWKYYQYLSGVDAPLKSNLEMVRIFKALKGSFNAEVKEFDWYRLNRKRPWNSPLPLFKTSLSATFSRESADFMVKSKVVDEQIKFLKGTECADESLWATIAGNPQKLEMPGGFSARKRLSEPDKISQFIPGQFYNVTSRYLSRYQQYSTTQPAKCDGYYYQLSCVYGVYDLPNLIRRHELIAHKLYLDYQPAAFLCLIQNIRSRSLNPMLNFTAVEYL